ncbi:MULTISPECIES: DUF4352 domain-containing protein [unclassified Streptomyces]|uniref:DUF4352 domain-containing protein n=1 Tax=unclassified Streptomyces TaxID=2593676 RepID=UPI0006AE369A|nr:MULTISPECIES: DUF4352 domain-containing protein [unclassified Streptomyces]KOU89508.1 hypothetical protein ADK93_10950 [Streptomyces sp. XY58]KOV08624.1 hypothetical protein ADK89_07665 [Streptomyces sp. XY37]KOV50751.1 hypothetical protein ADK99_09145 [Streptomyces sp. MMG1064]
MIPPKPTDDPTLPAAPVPAPAGSRPSRHAAVLLAVWTLLVAGVSSGITAAVVGGDSGDIESAAAPTVSPSIRQDTHTYPADPPQEPEAVPSPTTESFAMGEKAKSGGATVLVKKVSESASVTLDDFESEKVLKAGAGAKFAIVETTVYNDGTEPFDPVCGGGISQGLVDAEGRKFDLIEDAYLVKANRKAEACGEEVQPGFERDAVFVYKLPADASPAKWTFSGSRGMTEGDLAVVRLAVRTTSS